MGLPILDIALVLVLVGYLVYGFRAGLALSLGAISGVVLGVVAAFLAIPLVSSWVTDAVWRVPSVVATAIVLIVLGHTLGSAVGRYVRRGVDRTPLRIIDRLLGAVVGVVVTAGLISMLAFSASGLGIPFVSQAVSQSTVLGVIHSLTPTPVQSLFAELRSTVAEQGVPRVLGLPTQQAEPAELPDIDLGSPALTITADSVVKVTGTAWKCGQNQSGSGFVVSPGRIVTNAHVVAGVSEPVIETPRSGTFTGRVVSFDPERDLAVIAVDGLPTPALPAAETLPVGSPAVVAGYPLGGPFRLGPAAVSAVSPVDVPNIYGTNPRLLEVYTLTASVQPGNSGGPLLTTDGRVAGVVFAKSEDRASVGYALTMAELAPVLASADSFDQSVAPGDCTVK
ncbi:MarP family serine protease [Homoserinimonas sp. OAct 916]|uniref:MarP family serine protease n=1 Tax=Homoserinimonas sp. OAct 916 TaxID=2211450 RepID=UPI000DBE9643|nr:MarP family serine protease [Homoserinimonas sp. OAct 916]